MLRKDCSKNAVALGAHDRLPACLFAEDRLEACPTCFSTDPKVSSAFSLWHKICDPVEHLNSVSATCVIEVL